VATDVRAVALHNREAKFRLDFRSICVDGVGAPR
jgi:hypothetical protein